MSKQQSLSTKGARKDTTVKVVIQGIGHEKKSTPSTPTPKAEVTAPPPLENFNIKDEVEMLRAGFKNKHGNAVKTQAQSMSIEL